MTPWIAARLLNLIHHGSIPPLTEVPLYVFYEEVQGRLGSTGHDKGLVYPHPTILDRACRYFVESIEVPYVTSHDHPSMLPLTPAFLPQHSEQLNLRLN